MPGPSINSYRGSALITESVHGCLCGVVCVCVMYVCENARPNHACLETETDTRKHETRANTLHAAGLHRTPHTCIHTYVRNLRERTHRCYPTVQIQTSTAASYGTTLRLPESAQIHLIPHTGTHTDICQLHGLALLANRILVAFLHNVVQKQFLRGLRESATGHQI